MTTSDDFKPIDEAYSGFVTTTEGLFVEERIRCRPSNVDGFLERFGSSVAAREAVSPDLAPIGAWRTLFGRTDEITHIYRFANLATLEAATTSLAAAGLTAVDEAVEERATRIFRPVDYCRADVADTGAGAAYPNDRVYLSMFVSCTRTGVGDYIKHYGAGIARRGQVAEHLVPVGAWRTIYGGTYYQVNHVYAFDSFAEMEDVRSRLFTDAETMARIKINTSPPNFWEWGGNSELVKPVAYSRMQ